MTMNHLIKLAALPALLCLTSCESGGGDQLPSGVNEMARPVTILACNEEGVVLLDANGAVLAYNENFYFAQTLFKEGYAKGDVFLP